MHMLHGDGGHHRLVPKMAIGVGIAMGLGFVIVVGGSMAAGAALMRHRMRKHYPCCVDDEEFEALFEDEGDWDEYIQSPGKAPFKSGTGASSDVDVDIGEGPM